jgi:propanol-preferring alcohol dehydrogenase
MKAWQFTDVNEPLVLAAVPEPVPGEGEVVIDVVAAGLCHSDVSVLRDPASKAMMPYLPFTIGHEIAGVVSALGPGVTEWKPGDRVGVCPTAGPTMPGFTRPGGFAAKHLVPAGELVAIPDNVDMSLGAAATDAGMTSYHAVVVRGGLQPGMKVGIIGIGGLGQIGARAAVLKGAHVHVAEPKREIWPLAEALGAEGIVGDAAEWAGQGFDLVVDFAGFDTTGKALDATRFAGTVVQVGLGRTEARINVLQLIQNRNLLGSMGGTKQDIADLYAYMSAGQLAPAYTDTTFDRIPEGIERLEKGEVTGRLVARLDR